MKRLLASLSLVVSLTACDSKAQELLCTKAGKVTVHYKNANDVYYNKDFNAYYIIYDEGVVFYVPETGETCSIIRSE